MLAIRRWISAGRSESSVGMIVGAERSSGAEAMGPVSLDFDRLN